MSSQEYLEIFISEYLMLLERTRKIDGMEKTYQIY